MSFRCCEYSLDNMLAILCRICYDLPLFLQHLFGCWKIQCIKDELRMLDVVNNINTTYTCVAVPDNFSICVISHCFCKSGLLNNIWWKMISVSCCKCGKHVLTSMYLFIVVIMPVHAFFLKNYFI